MLRDSIVALACLMSPADEVEVVPPEELHHDVLPKGERNPSVVLAPSYDITVRV